MEKPVHPNYINFSKQLIKGRIAEMIFEQMLRDAGKFTVLSFGYENILPELMHQQHDIQVEETMEIIRRAPDFAVINNESHEVHLIEVKYRRHYIPSEILKVTELIHAAWKPSYLFLATPTAFYFDQTSQIIKKDGKIAKLDHPFIPNDLQKKYLTLMNTFITTA